MFISEEEAKRRLEDSRNIFSPSYVPISRRDNGSHSDDSKDEDSSEVSGDLESTGQEPAADAPTQTLTQKMETKDIDRLLAGAVHPLGKRTSSLRGQVDTQVHVGAVAHLLGNTSGGQLFGLSTSQAQAYEKGLSSTEDMREMKDRVPERTRRLKLVKDQIAERASNRLATALNSLTDDKIDECSAMKLSAIAKDMAVVVDKVTKDSHKAESIHFHIFRPEMKQVNEYTTVHVSSPLVINSDGGASS